MPRPSQHRLITVVSAGDDAAQATKAAAITVDHETAFRREFLWAIAWTSTVRAPVPAMALSRQGLPSPPPPTERGVRGILRWYDLGRAILLMGPLDFCLAAAEVRFGRAMARARRPRR